MSHSNKFTPLQRVVLQTAIISLTKGVQVSFIDYDIECENEHELVIEDYVAGQPAYKVIRKDKSRFGATTSLAPFALIDNMVDINTVSGNDTEDMVMTVTRYVPDFDVVYENTKLWPAEWNEHGYFYTTNFYDDLTAEMQKHAAFKNNAVNVNGELVTRDEWEEDQ